MGEATSPKERPILFSGAMVRAILADQKTQTRRIIRPEWLRCLDPADEEDMPNVLAGCPYGKPGDRLWVRETWGGDDLNGYVYRADHEGADLAAGELDDGEQEIRRWHPSIFMRRPASRITLEVTGIRVQRLQDIAEDDIQAEGVTRETASAMCGKAIAQGTSPRLMWSMGWDAINGKRAAWASNPWVWVLSFRRAQEVSRG